MVKRFCHVILYFTIPILWGLSSLVSCDGSGRRAAMLSVLDETDSLNRSYIPITSDSLINEATTYFDSHGTPNERLRAHYLLGCAYRDMGEAPRAIETWKDAVSCADTTATDCDYETLGKAHSQMANLFLDQLLLSDAIDARKQAYRFTLMSKDTLVAIHEYKMMASSYLLQNKNDSAEAILKEALNLYHKHGYLQEELKASTMLMYLYADQPSNISDLKDLIDRYETDCSLFDKNQELPPSKRQYYYYKGRYYEGINQLDSAEHCYRKIFRPGMSHLSANPMYKGLLSVFQKKHTGDSIAKYANLYCMSIDSSSVLKDRELTAHMAANYNYNRYQKQALENAEKANNRLYFVVVLLSLSILGIMEAIFFYLRYRKKQKVLEVLREEYEEAQKNYSRTQNQLQQLDEKHRNVLNSLQKENAESHAIITMLNAQHEEEKKQLIQQLRSHTERVEQLENRLAEYDVLTSATSNGDIEENLHKLADAGRKASVLELRRLRDYAYREAPSFHDAITKAKSPLSIREENICVMIRQGFMASEIAILLGMSPQSLSNSKKRILKNMFGLDGKASDLNEEIIRI